MVQRGGEGYVCRTSVGKLSQAKPLRRRMVAIWEEADVRILLRRGL